MSRPLTPSPSLEAPLRSACARVHRLRAAKGLLLWTALMLGTLFLMLGADILAEPESRGARWAMSGSLALIWIATLAASLVGVIRARPSAPRMARHLEERNPDWQECVSTALELERDPTVSNDLRDYLRDQAAAAAGTLRPADCFPRTALRPALRLAGAAALLPLALFALWPLHALTALHRLAMPWSDPGNAFAARLAVRPGDAIVPAGASLTLTALSSEAAEAGAALVCEYPGGRLTRERMAATGASAGAAGWHGFTLDLRHLKETFRYRVEAGRARSRMYTVTVEPLPALEDLTATLEPPAYTRRARSTNRWDDAVLSVPLGSRVRLAARMNKPVTRAEARAPGGASPPPSDGITPEWAMQAVAEHTGEWTFAFSDRHGFASLPDARRMKVVADAAPRVTLVEPRITELEVKADAVLPVEAAIEEDYGLMEVGLQVRTGGPPRNHPWERPGTMPPSGLLRVRGVLDLAALGAAPGQTLRVRLRAADTRPPELQGPQEAFSKELVIRVTGEAKSPARQEEEKLNAQMQKALEQARQAIEEARRKAEREAAGQTPEKPRPQDNPRDEIARAREAMREAARDPLAGYHPRTAEKMRELGDAAREAMEKSGEVREEQQREERARLARELQALLDQMARELDEARKLFQQDQRDAGERVAMRELADRQERHSEKAVEKPGEEPPKEWRDEQRQITQEVARMAGRDPETREELARQAAAKARELAARARELAEAQKQMSEAAQQAAENRGDEARAAMEQALARQEENQERTHEDASDHPESPSGDSSPESARAQESKAGTPESGTPGEETDAKPDSPPQTTPESARAQEQKAGTQKPGTPGEETGAKPDSPPQPAPESARAREMEARAQERSQALSAAQESLEADLPRAAALAQEEMARAARDLERETRATVAQARPLNLPNDPAGTMEQRARQALDKVRDAERATGQWNQQADKAEAKDPGQAGAESPPAERQAARRAAEGQREAAERLRELANAAEQLERAAQEQIGEQARDGEKPSGEEAAAQGANDSREPEQAGAQPGAPPPGAPREQGQAGRENAPEATPVDPAEERAQALAQALASAARATNAPTPPGAREAAKEAAAALREAARGNPPPPQTASPPAPGRGVSDQASDGPGDASPPPDRAPPPGGGALADRLADLFLPVGRDWADIRGGLPRGLTGDTATRVAEDYSDLVRDYYESLRREAAGEDP